MFKNVMQLAYVTTDLERAVPVFRDESGSPRVCDGRPPADGAIDAPDDEFDGVGGVLPSSAPPAAALVPSGSACWSQVHHCSVRAGG